jgi:type VI secretion system protein ImpK
MTPKFASAVDPILLHVLGLLERIARQENLSHPEERLRIRALLDRAEAIVGRGKEWELAKYALVSWIDEVLLDVEWQGREWWSNNVLEIELFNTRLCNELFYTRAQEASTLPQRDALEVFYVCVVLGFRGLYRDPVAAEVLAEPRGLPRDLESWAKQTALAIRLGQGRPPIIDSATLGAGAPPLKGQSFMIWSLLVGVILAALNVIFLWLFFFDTSA